MGTRCICVTKSYPGCPIHGSGQTRTHVLTHKAVLNLIARWWADGGASLNPDALLGDSDKTIRELVEDTTGIKRE